MKAAVRTIDPDELLAHADWVRALARRLASDDALGEDIAQAALVVALNRAPRHDDKSEFAPRIGLGPWLAGVVRNLAWKSRRSRNRRARHEGVVAPRAHDAAPDELAARAEAFRDVAEAVAALDPVYRDVVVLRFFDGIEMRDVAARLDVPVETARTRLKRALATLRARLDRRHGDRAAWAALVTGPTASRVARGADEAVAPTAALAAGKVVAAAVVLLLLAGGAWVVASAWDGGRPTESATASATTAVAPPLSSRASPAVDLRSRRSGRAVDASPTNDATDAPAIAEQAVQSSDTADKIVVHVVDEAGDPVVGVPIALSQAGRVTVGGTDAHGVWRAERPDVEATVFANVEKPLGARQFVDARTTVAPHAAEARLVLVEASVVEGRVVGPDGTPLPLLEIEVLVEGERVCKTNSEDGGVFSARVPLHKRAVVSLTGTRYVRSGGYGGSKATTTPGISGEPLPKEWAESETRAMQTAHTSPWDGTIDDPPPGATNLVLVARPVAQDGEIDVRIVDPGGAPISGVHVAAYFPGGVWVHTTEDHRTDADGRVHLQGLDRRRVRVDPWLDGADSSHDWLPPVPLLVVPRGQETTLAFRAALPVAGVVVVKDGSPARGARVRVFAEGTPPEGTPMAEAAAGEDGTFRILVPFDSPRDLRVDAVSSTSVPFSFSGSAPFDASRDPGVKASPGTVGLRLVLGAR